MIRITLYEECILSNEYNEVFHYSIFENYLNTLAKSQTFELDTVYQENSGTLVFDYEILNKNIYNYNYMKIETYDENENLLFKRYCFVDSIKLKNDTVYLDYSEDIWQSYSKDLNIRESYLSRSRLLNYSLNQIRIYSIPIEYQGNSGLTYNRLLPYEDEFCIVAQFQFYNTESFGKATNRTAKSAILYRGNASTVSSKKFTLKNAVLAINEIYKNVQREMTEQGSKRYFRVDNILLIPYNFIKNTNFESDFFPEINNNSQSYFANYNIVGNLDSDSLIVFNQTDEKNALLSKEKQYIKSFTVNNNFKNFSVGTMTNQFEIVNNGLTRYLQLYFEMNTYNFDMYLEFDDKMTKITNDFNVDLPYDVLDGEVLAQRKMQRTLSNARIAGNVISGSIGNSLSENFNIKSLYGETMLQSRERYKYDIKKTANDESSTLYNGILSLIETNQRNFSSTKGTFTSDDGILNATYGIISKSILSDNDSIVTNFINNTGYITYQIGGNEFLENLYTDGSNKYNVLKFDFVKAYGKFSQEICYELKQILLKGFKIRYTQDV